MSLPCGHCPLQEHQMGANLRMIGGIACNRRNLLGPHGVGHVLALQVDPLAGHAKIEGWGQSGQLLRPIPIDAGLQSGQRDRPVHGPGIQIAIAQPPAPMPARPYFFLLRRVRRW